MLERFEGSGGALVYRSSLLEELGVPHAFTTRRGACGAPWDVGHLGAETTAFLRAVLALPVESRAADLRQVHGCGVHEVTGALTDAVEADALVTERADRFLLVRTADCVPVLLASEGGARVAAVHAGWRGIVAGVVERALERLGDTEAAAAIGPSLCAACFEVGDEVVEAFRGAGLAEAVLPRVDGKHRIDLRAAVAIRLEQGGVRRIDGTDRCTYEHADELWSHRRDVTHGGAASTGRMAALIAVRRSAR